MPPRAGRSQKRDSVGVAVRKHLCASASAVAAATNGESARASTTAMAIVEAVAAASSPSPSRVSRRRHDVVPQATPEWQQMALKAAAPARLDKRRGGKAGARQGGSTVSAVAASRKSPAVTAKSKLNGRRTGTRKGRAKADGGEDEAAALAESPSQRTAGAGHSSLDVESDAASSSSSKHVKPLLSKAGKAAAAPTSKRGKRVPVAELLCPRCRLRMDQWPFCGLSGEAHVLRAPPSVAKEEEEEQSKETAAATAPSAIGKQRMPS
ncbi:hypothetical protein LSCM1_05060 [Leishmania martiniquensis]|uniref:Uncharacterized protein n=1 Tax=Leishmania martiniquensis TaxID=1580590 RepID=A0A836G9B9_9TRYP|nr:hypothetical protein LSCM1_05060 [Leishmania martiniquensis]